MASLRSPIKPATASKRLSMQEVSVRFDRRSICLLRELRAWLSTCCRNGTFNLKAERLCICNGDTPRGAAGRLTAGERQILKVGEAFEVRVGGEQDLSAPDRAIGPVSRPIKRETDQPPVIQAVVCHAGGDVGVMVLHPDAPG